LGLTAAGAAALLAPVLGGATATDAEAAQSGAVPIPPAAPRVRRVVTGLNGAGKSFIAVDDQVPVTSIYATTAAAPIGKSPEGESRDVGKATSETRFFMAAIPPSKDPKPNLTNRLGFHQTMGIAYCFILNGELAFLTDTQETKVKAGDVIVERHTWHSWRNEGSEPVSMLITVVTTA
jgi:hypothetical protein